MTQFSDTTFQCGDGEALVTYAYGESSAAEQKAIAAHLARCHACAEELAALGATREQLAAWTPPAQTLGFQITRPDPGENPAPAATILRPAAWWNRPLPAWAQMAAAVIIFASGVAIGTSRTAPQVASSTTSRVATVPVAARAGTTPTSVTRDEMRELEARLKAELKGELVQMRAASASDVSAGDSRAVMQRVTQMIAASEARTQKELDFRTAVLANDVAMQRRIDNANIEQQLRGTKVRALNNQQDINSLAQRVGYTPTYSPYVP